MIPKRISKLIFLVAVVAISAVQADLLVSLEPKLKLGKCLKANGEGDMVKLADCVNGKSTQQWMMEDISGSQFRSTKDPDLCIAMGMLLKTCKDKSENEKQIWEYVEGKGLIRNTFSGLCMNPFDSDMVGSCADGDEVKWIPRYVSTNGGADEKDEEDEDDENKKDDKDKEEDEEEDKSTATQKAYQIDLNGEGEYCLTTGFFGTKGKLKIKPCDKSNVKAQWLLDDDAKTIRLAAKPNLCVEIGKIADGKSLRLNKCRDTNRKKQQWNWRINGFGGSDPIRSDLRRAMCIYHTESGTVKLGFAATHCVLPMSRMQWAFHEIDTAGLDVPDEPDERDKPKKESKSEKTFKDCSWQKIEAPEGPRRRFGHHAYINGDAMVITDLQRTVKHVYVYKRDSNGKWKYVQKIGNGDIEFGDGYGFQNGDISLNGKYIAITAKEADSDGMKNNGAVIIFEKDNKGLYAQVAYFTGEHDGDLLGNNLALEGDTILVGARGANNGRGVVYAFRRKFPGVWERYGRELVASDVAKGENFGRRINFRGQTAVIATLQKGNLKGTGDGKAVYVFDDDRGNGSDDGRGFSETQKLIPDDPSDLQSFGFKVDIDHFSDTIAVGAKRKNGKGVVLVFTRKKNGRWAQSARLRPDTYKADYLFGADVALEGDTILVSALSEEGSGLVYVYTGHGSDWKQQLILSLDNVKVSREDGFGDSLDISKGTAALGAPTENGKDSAVYIIDFCKE